MKKIIAAAVLALSSTSDIAANPFEDFGKAIASLGACNQKALTREEGMLIMIIQMMDYDSLREREDGSKTFDDDARKKTKDAVAKMMDRWNDEGCDFSKSYQ